MRAVANWLRYRVPLLHLAYNMARQRPLSEPITEMNTYIPFEILELAKARGFSGAFVKAINQNGHRGIVFYAKKSFDESINVDN